ncbi:heterotetrameric sarcosine oxidase alpha subunit [Paraburkholderia caballeronis]|uniref:sarcosine oxidase subunit alpha family protein n=1 Tax=Paraburkholderia caballeronis TaxID=416943 RepID=UPI0010663DD7|nr:sarcosine oxidase subunit alpha family protein [Paraburkholderia caballeronis]TDV33847.1 heterotetrameric sarcosine oxidase alpha subunit [Paraburkholderia caballeronis]
MSLRKRIASYGTQAHADHKTIPFMFDGRRYTGLEGDTLAAALLANGIDIVGRSFKLHRPRGLMGTGAEEPNGLVQLESGAYTEPNARATLVPLYPGLEATSQNAWPNARHDVLGILDRFQRILPASFYYKSMMWPNWHIYERFVRPLAGLGKAPALPDVDAYQKHNIHCDLLVCGAGPAGLMAALVAGLAGLRVILADDRDQFGGSLANERFEIDGRPAPEWVVHTCARLAALPNVRLLPRTSVFGYYENNFLAAAEHAGNHGAPAGQTGRLRERLWRIRARTVVLATGAIERPLAFANNDRPGVMLASAVRMYLNRFGIVPATRAVVVTNNNDAYRTAFDLHHAGVKTISIVDTRRHVDDDLTRRVHEAGIAHYAGYGVRDIDGRRKVRGMRIVHHLGDGQLAAESPINIRCDLVAMSSGWTPTIHLYSQAGGTLRYDERNACLVPEQCGQNVHVVGAAGGNFTLPECLEQGRRVAASIVEQNGAQTGQSAPLPATHAAKLESMEIEPYWFTRNARTDKQWLDFQYDVKVSDVELALRENFRSVEHVKRYTTGGMSVDQGKLANFNILAIIAQLTGRPIEEVGTTRFRPPWQPVTLGTLSGNAVGERYATWQTLPAHAWHQAHRARFGDYGWVRPDYYPKDGEDMHAAIAREIALVRHGVGMFDGSSLGKIEVQGPDAAAFLDRMYVNNLANLKPGFARYAMLANDNGVLIDDGVVVRLSETHFLVHATSGAVNRITLLLEEYLQCEWRDLRVHLNNVTTQWANVTVSGPKARDVLQRIESDVDFTAAAFAHMQFRAGTFAGVPARILRASFTGEVTFEVSVPARYAQALWECVEAAGQPFGIAPYGVEAIDVLRIEKGYLHIGTDTDGLSNPLDIGWGKIIGNKKSDFIGKRSLQRPADAATGRLQFVGVEGVDPAIRLPVGGHFVESKHAAPPSASHGYVTSSCLSPTLGKSIGLGLLRDGLSRLGEEVHIFAEGRVTTARVVAAAHFDPHGERLNG